MPTKEKAKKILEESFEPIELENAHGLVKKEYKEHIKAFKRADNLTAWGYASSSQLYENSILIKDWFAGEILIPLIRGTYVYSRNLKYGEPEGIVPKRFENALVSYSEGLPIPEPLGILIQKNGCRKYLSSFAGEQNIALLLNRENLYLESREHELQHAELYRRYWSLEEKMNEEWARLPNLENLFRLFLTGGKSVDELDKWRKEVKKKLSSEGPPCWLTTLYFSLKKDLIDSQFKDVAERDISELFENKKQLNQFEKSAYENKTVRPPKDVYKVSANLGNALKIASNKGFFLYEIAPRDIVIDYDLSARFADTEKMDWLKRPLTKSERRKQFALLKRNFLHYKKPGSDKTNHFAYNRFMEETKKAYFS